MYRVQATPRWDRVMRSRRAAVAVLCFGFAAVRPAAAQSDRMPARLQATRPALEQLLQSLEQAGQARDSSDEARTGAVLQAAAVRGRLTDGDFQAGDRVLILVEGGEAPAQRPAPGAPRSVEQQLSDTFTVGPDRSLTLPVVGVVALRGVLRSELEAHLTRELGRFIIEPVLHARPLIRISVVGAVAKPGFYAVPADAVLADALMAAGGLTADAKLDKLRIERSGDRLWQGGTLQQAMTEGRTLDEMNLRAGDQFVVPARGKGNTYDTVRTIGILLSIPITVYTLTKIF